MPRVGVRRIGTGWSTEPKLYERALRRTMNNIIKPEVTKLFYEVTAGKRYSTTGKKWKHQVTFRARFSVRQGDAILYIFPAGKNKDIWNFVTKGTEPHSIDAKNAPYLVFPFGGPGQKAKTRLPRGGGGLTQTLGMPGITRWARVKHVDHPGSDPRKFEERIAKEYQPKFNKHVTKTIRGVIAAKNRPFVGSFGVRR